MIKNISTSLNDKIIIVGAGLCGSLLAIRLAQKGFQVVVYERRPDMRKGVEDAGRSINLALSARGLLSLEKAGIKEAILKECIPMRGRMIHPLGGEKFLSKYSGRAEDYINSVSRPGLNLALIKEADQFEKVELKFEAKVTKVDLEEARIEYELDGEFCEDQGVIVIGTDGAGSVVRRAMMGQTTNLLFNYSQDFLRHGYKELSILPAESGGWQIEKEALHIWPNGSFMIIALPNLDGSFTLTMFHPYEGEAGFNTLNTKEKVKAFFEKYYPTLLPYIPHLYEEYFENPVGTLGTIKCYPWQAYGRALIMGDAAHAIVPFYGQGMNASLEDVRVFNDLLEQYGDDWEKLFKHFQDARKENADAIGDLAIDNFYEMRDHVDDVAFMRKRKIEMQLEQQFPDYYSKYSLVTFQPKLSYQEAMMRGRKQDEILLDLCKNENFEQVPLQTFFDKAMI
ncbi:MAG: NAD(P)/FAD-dependent oxidoreductase [Bacteroidota bacterium]